MEAAASGGNPIKLHFSEVALVPAQNQQKVNKP